MSRLKRKDNSGRGRSRKERRQRGKPGLRGVKMLMMVRRTARKMTKPKRQRMLMTKELIVVATEVEDDLIKDRRWSIRKRERPHHKMRRLLSSKVEQRL